MCRVRPNGRRTGQPLALRGPAAQPGQLRVRRRLVDEGRGGAGMPRMVGWRLSIHTFTELGDVEACALLGPGFFL